ncbi:glycosyltransferase family 2 protein [Solirubrobacter ginsenosidimutans]|uniref:Glycosyltransferase family 2 protein n=1 Tax=Solirubrobacter ginsenosidimutans TaxID=490573 RepID=A0A9X3MXN3_9ACTN|nr:glycosyltransferase family 2 protein [Solirubrobacter ginsenosidimutans]MDA0164724.1 glycosyltransferase family 2 protein [Solirubrobacter ginsenosidimutans]
MPTIDVAVVAYNHFELTQSCLEHLERQTREFNLLVCDNGSTDGTAERVAERWPLAKVSRLETNHGFATACNTAVGLGSADYLVLMNNDVDCRPDFLERVVAPLENDADVASVASLMVRPDGERIDSIGLTADATLSPFPRHTGRPIGEAADERPVLLGPAGTAAAYRRSAWDALGGLDERIHAYGEDFDLVVRLRAAGWKTAAAPDAVGIHLGSATYGHRSRRQRQYGGFGRAYLMRRYGLLKRREAARTALTEAIVVAGDAVISRDLAALQGRIAGWRAARDLPKLAFPPPEAIDHDIAFREAIDRRRGVYSQ